MKTGGKYRFHLSWGMETEEQLLTGEFLEKLGHNKSKFILRLVSNYLEEHPEAIESSVVKLVMEASPANKLLEERFREIIQQEIKGLALVQSADSAALPPESPANNDDIAEMAKNLAFFDLE